MNNEYIRPLMLALTAGIVMTCLQCHNFQARMINMSHGKLNLGFSSPLSGLRRARAGRSGAIQIEKFIIPLFIKKCFTDLT